jgi:prepilin-type processing-associated H-X9-DG protein
MKGLSHRQTAMTLIEILVVIAMVAVLIAMVIPPRHRPVKSSVLICMNHLKQIDLGFLMYADDNHGKIPMQYSITNGGTMEFLQRNQTFPHYQKLSPYIPAVEILVCPADKNRHAASDYNNLSDTNLSYFLNADISTNDPSSSILAGDRNLAANGKPVTPGLLSVSANLNLSFTPELHPTVGVLAFADGHVEACRKTNLNSLFTRQNLASFRLSIP